MSFCFVLDWSRKCRYHHLLHELAEFCVVLLKSSMLHTNTHIRKNY